MGPLRSASGRHDGWPRLPARTVWAVLGVALAWLATRALVVWLLHGRHSWVEGDVGYFEQSMASLRDVGLGRTLVEYPLPALVVLALPGLLAPLVATANAYADTVTGLSLAADAAYLVLLARYAGTGRRAALVVWVLAVPLLGATTYARFDLVPGILAGAGLLLLARHPRVAAASVAVATGLKLWPVLVLPAMAAVRESRHRVVVVAASVGGLLAVSSLLVAGWDRLVSPLTWQAARGLQIESVAATPAMVAWALAPGSYQVVYTEHNAFEIAGPGTRQMMLASDVLSAGVLLGLLLLWVLAFRRGRDLTAETVSWLALTAVTGFVVTSKVLSPQYLLWLLPLAAAAVATSRSRRLRVWAGVLLAAAAATQVVFPELYPEILGGTDRAGWAVLALAVRNVLLVGLLLGAAGPAVRGVLREDEPGREPGVSAAGRSSASRPVRQGTSDAASGGGPTTPT